MNLISGYMLINKSIPSTGGPYTVRFYDEDGVLIQTDTNVPQYGRASCTLLDGTFNDDLEYFKGWNPAPDSVTRDMDCYPVYGDYIISHEEIHDSWETICADNGAHYPLGAYKQLIFVPSITSGEGYNFYKNTYWTYGTEDRPCNPISMHMVKVAEGEDGSTSTWISSGVMRMNGLLGNSDLFNNIFGTRFISYARPSIGYVDWDTSFGKKYLNEVFIQELPASIQRSIKQVTKYHRGYMDIDTNTLVERGTLNKIWVPSMKEFETFLKDKTGWSSVESLCEIGGIDYSKVYTPTYLTNSGNSGDIALRTAAPGFSTGSKIAGSFVNFNDNDDVVSTAYARSSGTNLQLYGYYCPFGFCL